MKLNKLAALAVAMIGVAALSTGCMTHRERDMYSPTGQLLSHEKETTINNPRLPDLNLNVLGNQEVRNERGPDYWGQQSPGPRQFGFRDRLQGIQIDPPPKDQVFCEWLDGPNGYGLYWWDDRSGPGVWKWYPDQY